jgi:hypothetical protein
VSIEFNSEVQLLIAQSDLLAMIEDQVCGNYGSFKRVRPYNIEVSAKGFLVSFAPLASDPGQP